MVMVSLIGQARLSWATLTSANLRFAKLQGATLPNGTEHD